MFEEDNIEDDEFDARIIVQRWMKRWMKRWPILYHNKHTAHAGIAPPSTF